MRSVDVIGRGIGASVLWWGWNATAHSSSYASAIKTSTSEDYLNERSLFCITLHFPQPLPFIHDPTPARLPQQPLECLSTSESSAQTGSRIPSSSAPTPPQNGTWQPCTRAKKTRRKNLLRNMKTGKLPCTPHSRSFPSPPTSRPYTSHRQTSCTTSKRR